jgi:hypothetical protein
LANDSCPVEIIHPAIIEHLAITSDPIKSSG